MTNKLLNVKSGIVRLALFLSIFFLSFTDVNAKKDITSTHYDIEGVETGAQGTYLVKVYIYTNKPEATTEQIKYAAVHGVIFRGFSGKGFSTQKPLARPEIETQKADFFNAFWTGGDYMAYASIVNAIADRLKVSSKEYKIGAIVSVSKDSLRKSLEDAGVIKELGYGF